MNKILRSSTLVLIIAVAALSCKKRFDQPPGFIPPAITANKTIAQLKALYTGTGFLQIADNIIIEGVVVADDRSGNYYKAVVIQDSTAGIELQLDGTNLYTDYPIGRKVYVKAKGLVMGNYGRLVQLGGYIDNSTPSNPSLGGIPFSLFNNYLIKGSSGNVINPKVVTVAQLNDSYQNMLIKLNNVSFAATDAGKPYADVINKISLNRSVRESGGGSIVIRTSGYANFAAELTPTGTGSVTAIYTVFNSTKQLIIRDTADVRFTPLFLATYFNQDFESTTINTPISLTGWGNYAQTGGVMFQSKTFGGNKYASITAFGSNQASVISWLVTPPINLAAITQPNKLLEFSTIDGFDNGATLKAYISTNYVAGSPTPWTATWTQLPATISGGSTTGYAFNFTSSGFLNLNAYTGTVHVAWKYEVQIRQDQQLIKQQPLKLMMLK